MWQAKGSLQQNEVESKAKKNFLRIDGGHVIHMWHVDFKQDDEKRNEVLDKVFVRANNNRCCLPVETLLFMQNFP